jgi:tRNA threonylcarbamoyladenosine biosynthesis protein TsaB
MAGVKNNLILCIETATEVCSVALSHSGKCIAEKSLVEQGAHGTQLTLMIDAILSENHFTIKDLCAVAYSSGPGSYTGLRIGLSVAKGICYGVGIPLIEVPTLLHMASVIHENIIRFPMIDARRMEVYAAIIDPAGKFIEQPFACLVETYDWSKLLKEQPVCFIGNGVEKSRPILSQFSNAVLHPGSISATSICEIAQQKFASNELADLAYHVPFYLKDANVTVSKKKLI